MYNIVPTGKFKKDLKTIVKRGYDTRLLEKVELELIVICFKRFFDVVVWALQLPVDTFPSTLYRVQPAYFVG